MNRNQFEFAKAAMLNYIRIPIVGMKHDGYADGIAAFVMNHRFLVLLALFVLNVTICLASQDTASSNSQPTNSQALVNELSRIQQQVQVAQTNLVLQTEALKKAQQELAAQDPLYRQLLEEKAKLNTEIGSKKAELHARFLASEGWQSAEKSRRAAFEALQQSIRDEASLRKLVPSASSKAVSAQTSEGNALESQWIKAVQARQEAAQNMNLAEQVLLRLQHDLEYQDDVCSRLHKDVKQMESLLIQKNSELAVREKMNEAWRAAEKSRAHSYATLKAVQNEEFVLQKELGRAEGSAIDSSEAAEIGP